MSGEPGAVKAGRPIRSESTKGTSVMVLCIPWWLVLLSASSYDGSRVLRTVLYLPTAMPSGTVCLRQAF